MPLLLQDWKLEFHTGIPVYRQIVNRIQLAVSSGELLPGEQLPTIRALHQHLDVNPNTVARAYRDLQHLGIIAAEQGSGCFVTPGSGEPPRLDPGEKQAKLDSLASRMAEEARREGLSLSDLLKHLNQSPNT